MMKPKDTEIRAYWDKARREVWFAVVRQQATVRGAVVCLPGCSLQVPDPNGAPALVAAYVEAVAKATGVEPHEVEWVNE